MTSSDWDALHFNNAAALLEIWASLTVDQKRTAFKALPRVEAEDLFLSLGSSDQFDLMKELSMPERRSWFRLLAPDDAADLIQEFEYEERTQCLTLLDLSTMKEVLALLAYAEDDAGGLMNPRFIRLRPDVTVDVAIRYIRAQAKAHVETIHYLYVLDQEQKLLGALSFRELFLSPPEKKINEIMYRDLITLPETMDQEVVAKEFSNSGLSALPVVDIEGRMKGIVTVDDVVDVVQEEATEDIQKYGGSEALGEPYLQVSLGSMIKKRAFWLVILFVGETFTATAMGFFGAELEKAVVLALFIPLIISSGGNSGSQATSLIIRSFALRELRLQDWWRVLRRELLVGASLGIILGSVGIVRILLWPARQTMYGPHYKMVAVAVATSVVGTVMWGTIAGSMLPFALRRLNLDPATASAPLVATLVDVTGLVIYFTAATLILHGILL